MIIRIQCPMTNHKHRRLPTKNEETDIHVISANPDVNINMKQVSVSQNINDVVVGNIAKRRIIPIAIVNVNIVVKSRNHIVVGKNAQANV